MCLNQIVSTNLFQEGLVRMDGNRERLPQLEKERAYYAFPLNYQVYGIIRFSKIQSFYSKIIVNKSKCSMIDL
jgi:hypothetical protein